jgi:hypothetical protein
MALDEKVDGPAQAESGKEKKQDQVHCALMVLREPAKKAGRLRGRTKEQKNNAS